MPLNWSVTQPGVITAVGVIHGTGAATTAGEVTQNGNAETNLTLGDGTNARIVPMMLFKGLGFGGTGNVTGLTTVLGSATVSNGSLTLVANQQVVGSTIHIHALGSFVVGTSQTITFEALLNGVRAWFAGGRLRRHHGI